MNERQYEALRLPCETAESTFRDRYRKTDGDVHSILTVIRYAGLNNGEPVWHTYTWGASVRLGIPLKKGGTPVVFRGRLDRDTIEGTVSMLDGRIVPWTAVRAAGDR